MCSAFRDERAEWWRWASHQGVAFSSCSGGGGGGGLLCKHEEYKTESNSAALNNPSTHTSDTRRDGDVSLHSALFSFVGDINSRLKKKCFSMFHDFQLATKSLVKTSNTWWKCPAGWNVHSHSWTRFANCAQDQRITHLATLYYDLVSTSMWPISYIMKCLFSRYIIHHHILFACTYVLYISFLSPLLWILATFFLLYWVSGGCLSHCFPHYIVPLLFLDDKNRWHSPRVLFNNLSQTIKRMWLSEIRCWGDMFQSKLFPASDFFSFWRNIIFTSLSNPPSLQPVYLKLQIKWVSFLAAVLSAPHTIQPAHLSCLHPAVSALNLPFNTTAGTEVEK